MTLNELLQVKNFYLLYEWFDFLAEEEALYKCQWLIWPLFPTVCRLMAIPLLEYNI